MTYLNWNRLNCAIRVVFDEFHYATTTIPSLEYNKNNIFLLYANLGIQNKW